MRSPHQMPAPDRALMKRILDPGYESGTCLNLFDIDRADMNALKSLIACEDAIIITVAGEALIMPNASLADIAQSGWMVAER